MLSVLNVERLLKAERESLFLRILAFVMYGVNSGKIELKC